MFKHLKSIFQDIHAKGWVPSVNNISSGVGMTFEDLLGKSEDNFSYPDFENIEIKTQRTSTNYPLTLFGLAPWGIEFPEIERLRTHFGYYDYSNDDDKKLNTEFFCSKNVLVCNRYFFNLYVNRKMEKIMLLIYDINYQLIDSGAYWAFDDIKEKLDGKLQYLGYVHALSRKKGKDEFFKYIKLECYKMKDFETFLDLIEKNIISVSITTSPIKYGPSIGKNKASCYFRIGKHDLNKLFSLCDVVDCNDVDHY